MTLQEAGTRLEISTSTLSRLENAQVLVDIHLLKDMLDLYGLTIDRWDPYLSLCRQARGRGWWRDYGVDDRGYVALEASANLVREFAVMSVPGLLQTADYARALYDNAILPLPEAARKSQVRVRMLRQQRLYTEDDPLRLVTVLDEAVLHREVGGPAVLREQLDHILIAAELDTVTLRILPAELGVHAGMVSGFILLGFQDPDEPDMAYLESIVGAQHIERAEQVARCSLALDRLQAVALGPAESKSLVEQLVARL